MKSNRPLDFFGRQSQLVKKYGKIPKQEFRKGLEDLLSNPYKDELFFLDTLPGTVTPEGLIRGLTSTIKKSLDSEYNLKQQQLTQSLNFQYRFVLFWSILALVIISLCIIVYLKYFKSVKDTKKIFGNVLAWTLFVVASIIILLFMLSFPLCRYVKSPFLSFFCSRSSWLSWLSIATLVVIVGSFFSTWYFTRSYLKKEDTTTKTRMLWSGFISVLFTVLYWGYNIYILVSTRSQIYQSTSKKEKELEEAAALLQQVKPRVGNLLQQGRSRHKAGSIARRIVSDPSKLHQILSSSTMSDSDKSLVVETAISSIEENKKKALEPWEIKRGEILKGPQMSQIEGYKERMSLYKRFLFFIGLYMVLFSTYYGINLYLIHKKVGKIDKYSPVRYISIVFSWLVLSLVSLLTVYVFYNGISNIMNRRDNFYSILYIFTLPTLFFSVVLLLTSLFTLRYLGIHFSKTASTSSRSQKIAMVFSWMSFSLILISSIVMILIVRGKFSYYLTHDKSFFETSSKEESDHIRSEVTDLQQTKMKPLAKSFDDQIAFLRSYLLNPTKSIPSTGKQQKTPSPSYIPSPVPPVPVRTPMTPSPVPPPVRTPTTPPSNPVPPPAPVGGNTLLPALPTLRDFRKGVSKVTGMSNYFSDGETRKKYLETLQKQRKQGEQQGRRFRLGLPVPKIQESLKKYYEKLRKQDQQQEKRIRLGLPTVPKLPPASISSSLPTSPPPMVQSEKKPSYGSSPSLGKAAKSLLNAVASSIEI